jgi:opacity protein-like surface antigen
VGPGNRRSWPGSNHPAAQRWRIRRHRRFGVGSQFSWEVYAGLDYAVTDHISAVAGFRYLSVNYEDGGAELKLDTYGPVLGATLWF